MTPRLVQFIHLLREHGLRISVAESLDALNSVQHIGLDDRELLRLSLRTTLVKSQQDFGTFDALFERFFTIARRRKRRRARKRQSAQPGVGPRSAPQADPPPSMASSARNDEPPRPAEDHSSSQALDALSDMERDW
ncbi:MAG: hypothetical protein ETSY1_25660 [Candidatus Entotheonella factor]|uniref:CoxE n=1 Tax=Entotheonella factor TaxID=1429438 RepID=W4LF00_ENTF1|nr:hypothetical protein [Candidatus Entotheonella palauensis]ETW96668.1 MAG: hypothetical protein ETSY1_25660 [Candidatus Entotheonella factor]